MGGRSGRRWRTASPRLRHGDQIQHVILLMMENRAFDGLLGDFQRVYPGLDGISPKGAQRWNKDLRGQRYYQRPTTLCKLKPDPGHDLNDVFDQLADGNQGFIRNFVRKHPKSLRRERDAVMGYYARGSLKALHALADEFLICDKWFCSVPGPTWPNRLFALSGTSLGRVKMPESIFAPNIHWYKQTTLFDRLNEAQLDWRVYHDGVPLSLLFTHQWRRSNLSRYRKMRQYEADAAGDAKAFPTFCLIEPDYLWPGANDDHPPHDVLNGERLIARVYNALRANAELWRSSLLIVTYDEHGGFYDHRKPPAAVPPDQHDEEFDFRQFGLRVPTLLVSPWVQRGYTDIEFSHTSLLKFMTEQFGLGGLGSRTAQANSISGVLTQAIDRTDTTPALPLPRKSRSSETTPPLTENQKAIVALADYLDLRTQRPMGRVAAERVLRVRAARRPEGAEAQTSRARAQVARFLRS